MLNKVKHSGGGGGRGIFRVRFLVRRIWFCECNVYLIMWEQHQNFDYVSENYLIMWVQHQKILFCECNIYLCESYFKINLMQKCCIIIHTLRYIFNPPSEIHQWKEIFWFNFISTGCALQKKCFSNYSHFWTFPGEVTVIYDWPETKQQVDVQDCPLWMFFLQNSGREETPRTGKKVNHPNLKLVGTARLGRNIWTRKQKWNFLRKWNPLAFSSKFPCLKYPHFAVFSTTYTCMWIIAQI